MQLVPPPCLNSATRDSARECNCSTGGYIISLLCTKERHKYLPNPWWLTSELDSDSTRWSGGTLIYRMLCARAPCQDRKAMVRKILLTWTHPRRHRVDSLFGRNGKHPIHSPHTLSSSFTAFRCPRLSLRDVGGIFNGVRRTAGSSSSVSPVQSLSLGRQLPSGSPS